MIKLLPTLLRTNFYDTLIFEQIHLAQNRTIAYKLKYLGQPKGGIKVYFVNISLRIRKPQLAQNSK